MKKREVPVVWRAVIPEELTEYNRLGYHKEEAFFDVKEIESVKRNALQLQESLLRDGNPGNHLTFEGGKVGIRSLIGLHIIAPDFMNTVLTPKLVALAESILGPDVYLHQSRIHYKPAFVGQGFDWHDDFMVWQWEDGMTEPRCVTFMIPLVEMRSENGPLQVIPGSHLSYDELTWESEVSVGDNKYREDSKTHRGACRVTEDQSALIKSSTVIDTIIAKPGDLCYFDANILHMSEDNTSQWDRLSLFIVINSMHNKLQDPRNGRSPRGERVTSRVFNKL